MQIMLKHAQSGIIRKCKVGFSWTTLFFGPFPALLRGDVKWFFIIALLALCTFTLSNYVFCFIYNKIYIKSLLENGYVAADDSVRNLLQAKGVLFSEQPTSINGSPVGSPATNSASTSLSSSVGPSGFGKIPSFSSSENIQHVQRPVNIGLIIGLVGVVIILLIGLAIFAVMNINPQTVMKHKGGVRIVLQIDKSYLPRESANEVLDQECAVIKKRIDGLGISKPILGHDHGGYIIVELPGFHDPDLAARIVGSTANLEFNLLRDPADLDKAIKVIDNVLKGQKIADTGAAQSDTAALKKSEAQAKAQTLFGGKEKAKDSTAVAESLSTGNEKEPITSFSELLTGIGEQLAVLESNKAKVDVILHRKDVATALERSGMGGSNFLWGHETRVVNASIYRMLYYVKSHPEMRGDLIKDSRGSVDREGSSAGAALVELEMNDKGTKTFGRITGANIGRYLAIVLDSTVYSAPVIRAKIESGHAQIEGSFTIEEAKNLAIVLRAGALPLPVLIMEQRVIKPGKDGTE
jgi:protein-export membrane protein SecD